MQIKGANLTNFLQELKTQNISVYDIKRISASEINLSIKSKQKAKFIAILNEKCYTIVSQNNSRQKMILKPFKNLSIIVGIIFGLLLNVLACFFVWNVVLIGPNELKQEILCALNQNGIKRFALKTNLNNQKIKNIIYQNVQDVSLVSVSQKGTTIFVNYTQKVLSPQISEEKENIIAKNDGLVASILVTSGTPLVKVGDYVKKGQVLISGETMEDNKPAKVQANGHVFAYVWKSATVQFPLHIITLARTQNTCTNYKVVFQNSVLFQSNNLHNFQKSETEEKTIYLINNVLPIKKIETTTYELEEVEISQEFDEQNKEKAISQAKLLCWEKIAGNEKILEEKTEINFALNIYFVTHYIKIKEQIS